tara:strand:+ start:1337 stop:2047 length:711 start_codon:yes stop_codon:yes gene_type:complete
MKNNGALYICYGDKYIKEGLISAESLKKFHPDLHVTFFSDKAFSSEFVDNVEIITPNAKRPKVEYINQTPYKETLFLDVDTVINHRIDDTFDLLDKFDMSGATDISRKRKKYSRIMPEYSNIPYSFSEINTGVLCFKKTEATENLFSLWRMYYKKYNKNCPWDQPSFRISLWESSVNFHTLSREYNIRSAENRAKVAKIRRSGDKGHLVERIYHMHHGCETLESAKEYCQQNFHKY